MNKNSKFLFVFLGGMIILSITASYYRFIILNDYTVKTELDCNPSTESCFVWECDPEVDGAETCTGNPEEDTWYYKIAYKNAKNITQCAEEDEECYPFQCMYGEEGCSEVTCTTDALLEYELGGECTNPIDFEEVEEESNSFNMNGETNLN